MKFHFKLVALLFLIVSLFFGWVGQVANFFLSLSISLQVFSLTQVERGLDKKLAFSKWGIFSSHKYRNTIAGKILEIGAILCLLGFFVSQS